MVRRIVDFAAGGASVFGRSAMGRRALVGAMHGAIMGGVAADAMGYAQGNLWGAGFQGRMRGAMVGGIAGGIGGAFGWRGIPAIERRLHPQLRRGANRLRGINPVAASLDEIPI